MLSVVLTTPLYPTPFHLILNLRFVNAPWEAHHVAPLRCTVEKLKFIVSGPRGLACTGLEGKDTLQMRRLGQALA